LKKRGTRHIGL